jgi:hypothetical protein
MLLIGQRERVLPNEQLAGAITAAVDDDAGAPITGTKYGDAILMAIWSFHESRWKGCVSGDHGRAWGNFQLQGSAISVACEDAQAARIWLRMAHDSDSRCRSLDADARLSQLASGTCARGRTVARFRMKAWRQAMGLLTLYPPPVRDSEVQ